MIDEEASGEGRAHYGKESGGADGRGAGKGPDVSIHKLRPGESLPPQELGGFCRGATFEKTGRRETSGEEGCEVVVAETAAVGEEDGDGDEKQEEVEMVVAADTVVDPDTVVVLALDAGAAEGAVFAAGRFGVVAGRAEVAWVEEDVVVGVSCQGGPVCGVQSRGWRP